MTFLRSHGAGTLKEPTHQTRYQSAGSPLILEDLLPNIRYAKAIAPKRFHARRGCHYVYENDRVITRCPRPQEFMGDEISTERLDEEP